MTPGLAGGAKLGYQATMSRSTNTIERAYQIATSGRCVELKDIRRQLIKEGFEGVEAHLSGSSIKRELQALIKSSRAPRPTLAER